jgi:putative heme-binding domain-containing protein
MRAMGLGAWIFLLMANPLGAADVAVGPDAVVGTWNLKFTSPDGQEHAPVLTLTEQGDRLGGTLKKLGGENYVAKEISLKDGTLQFQITGMHDGAPWMLTFRGKPQGDAIHGAIEYNHQGNTGSFAFEGQRVAKADDTGRSTHKPAATPAARIKAPKGFQVELIYSVPKQTEGSWVNMTVDPKGRLIVSDQYGKLYRVTPPPIEGPIAAIRIEPIAAPIGEAHGLLWAFDSLYVVVNEGRKYPSGLYRVRDTDGDDTLDQVEMLHKLQGRGEHGPHAVLLAPDGKSLYVVAGNATQLTEIDSSLVPRVWGEDNLLPRMPDGAGFMADEKAPGGCIYRVSPDGKSWELFSMGYRNPFDIAFNRDGELFTYDSDMEWDVNLPWYRPTRVLHVVSGSDFGYRGGSGKWPAYYIDSLPPVVNVGPGSPTGITFGYGAKFPEKYQEALYLCDWSYGKLYALHLKPQGATYTGELEEFLSGTPLALTDIVVNPQDGAMYFAVGGRLTQSGLYRVTYTGEASSPRRPASATALVGGDARELRHRLEAFHGHHDPKAIATAWPYLSHPDRFLRWAARVAIEFQDPATWRDRALAETSHPEAALNALLALTRVSAKDPAHRQKDDPPPNEALRDRILTALDRIAWEGLSQAQKLDLLRVYEVVLNRFGRPNEADTARLIQRFDAHYPASSRELNAELAQLLVFLQAPDVGAKTIALLEKAPTQEEQIDYARSLRLLKTGWTPELRKAYFSWMLKAATYKGGNSFRGFLANIQRDALANLSEAEKDELKPILEAKTTPTTPTAVLPERKFVKNWTLDELVPMVENGLKGRDYDRGRALFAAARCFSCHRFNDEGGGLGPDLSGVAGRFSVRDLLESTVQPSKVISDQYEAVTIATTDGRVITGRIVNLFDDTILVNPDMLDPNKMVRVRRDQIEEMKRSPVSMMPEGLLNTLDQDEVLDLFAYLLSGGNREDPMFQGGAQGTEGSKDFFNGKNLDGWEGLKEYWSVEEGALVGRAPAEGLTFNTFLCSQKKYKDFAISFQVRIKDANGNSGLQFRSRIADAEKFAVAGPQADMGQIFWGSLYGERDPGRMMKAAPAEVVRKVLKPADFNDYSVTCVGKHVTIKLNGQTTVDADFPELPDEGIIAWQLHAGFKNMEVIFKNIQFKDLSR